MHQGKPCTFVHCSSVSVPTACSETEFSCFAAVQEGSEETYYALRFTAYFPCVVEQGRFVVIDAVVLQPGPRYQPAFSIKEVVEAQLSPTSTGGIGWGADVGLSNRARVKGRDVRCTLFFVCPLCLRTIVLPLTSHSCLAFLQPTSRASPESMPWTLPSTAVILQTSGESRQHWSTGIWKEWVLQSLPIHARDAPVHRLSQDCWA